jgi:beta-lactamase class C
MFKVSGIQAGVLATMCLLFPAVAHAQESLAPEQIGEVVAETMRPLLDEHDLPGMAVAVTVDGQQYFYNFGVASKESGQRVNENTIFEIGSVSKTFTATLASYGEALGRLSISDPASRHIPDLIGSSFDQVTLRDLATYAAGGLPLQFPDNVTDPDSMITYYKQWQPDYPAGAFRRYSNPSIGLLGHIAAKSMGLPFDDLMEGTLFPLLGLSSSFISVPQDRIDNYAYGYTKDGKPIRVTPGVLDSEAYGVKTTSSDMIRFVETNMDPSGLDPMLRKAIAATHIGHYRIGPMTQGLGWEMYEWPIKVDDLLAGNSADMAMTPNKATPVSPVHTSGDRVLINKTGSTNGFGAYVAFVPGKHIGIVMLANKNYPIPARVAAAHRILTVLDEHVAMQRGD